MVADILDGPFNTPLLIATCWTTGAGFKMVVGTELEDPRVKPDPVAVALNDDARHVVVENMARYAPKIVKGVNVSEQKILRNYSWGVRRAGMEVTTSQVSG